MKQNKKKMSVAALLCAAALLFNPAWAASKAGGGGAGGDAYGAIAYDDENGDYGLTYNYDSRASAERDAKAECGNSNCKIAVWFKNSCGAVAENDKQWGWGLGKSQREAESEALSACGKSCKIVAWACTDR